MAEWLDSLQYDILEQTHTQKQHSRLCDIKKHAVLYVFKLVYINFCKVAMNIVRRCKITICRLMSLRLLLQCQRRRIADQAPAATPSQCLAFPFHDQPVPGLRHCRYSRDSRHSPCYSSC